MAKKNINISIDADIHEKAKKGFTNISAVCEKALYNKVYSIKKADLPEDLIQLKCTQCKKEIDFGYFCEYRQIFLCEECQESFNMFSCKFDKMGEHSHFRIPGLAGQHIEKKKEMAELGIKNT